MNGHFSEFLKRNKSRENHNKSLHKRVRKRKEELIGSESTPPEFDTPNYSKEDLDKLKNELTSKRKIKSLKIWIFSLLLLIPILYFYLKVIEIF